MAETAACFTEFGRTFALEVYLKETKARDDRGRDTTFHIFKVEVSIFDGDVKTTQRQNRIQPAQPWKIAPIDALDKITRELAALYEGKIVREDVEGRKLKDNVAYIPGPVTPQSFTCHLFGKLKELAAPYGYSGVHVKISDKNGFYIKTVAVEMASQ